MPTIIEESEPNNKIAITKAYRELLKQIIPSILAEKNFLTNILSYSNSEKKTQESTEKMLSNMFNDLQNEFELLIEKFVFIYYLYIL